MPTSVRHTGSVNNQKARAKADQLRKAGRFEEAAAEYAALWPDGDLWTGWGYAHSLRKSRRAAEALEVARALYVLDSKFPPGRSVYAWAVYDLCIRTATAPEPEVLKAAALAYERSGTAKRARLRSDQPLCENGAPRCEALRQQCGRRACA